MMNCDASGKSKGALIFANNTEEIDYVLIANRAADLIKKHLGIPTTIISKNVDNVTNQRYSSDFSRFISWNNKGRFSAFDESPYDTTILIDADYLVLDDRLRCLLDIVQDYMIMKNNRYLPGEVCGEKLGEYSINTSWATVIVFNKTERSRLLFDMVQRIQDHYFYYRSLYNIAHTNYRNDYAFTIADQILSGYTQDPLTQIPWTMTTLEGIIESIDVNETNMVVRYHDRALVLPRQDIHVMTKKYLQSDAFGKLVKDICA